VLDVMLVQGQEHETGISCLKRAYGPGSWTWRGLDHFKSCVRLSVEMKQ
jgi:hypothetical protein